VLHFFLSFTFGYLIYLEISRAKTVKVRLDKTKESASFLITALFTRLYSEGKSAAISKLAIFWVPSSLSYIVLAPVVSYFCSLVPIKICRSDSFIKESETLNALAV